MEPTPIAPLPPVPKPNDVVLPPPPIAPKKKSKFLLVVAYVLLVLQVLTVFGPQVAFGLPGLNVGGLFGSLLGPLIFMLPALGIIFLRPGMTLYKIARVLLILQLIIVVLSYSSVLFFLAVLGGRHF